MEVCVGLVAYRQLYGTNCCGIATVLWQCL